MHMLPEAGHEPYLGPGLSSEEVGAGLKKRRHSPKQKCPSMRQQRDRFLKCCAQAHSVVCLVAGHLEFCVLM